MPPRAMSSACEITFRRSGAAVQWFDNGSLIVRTFGLPMHLTLLDTETGANRPWKVIQLTVPGVRGLQRFQISRDGETCVYQTFRAVSELYLVDGLK